ncbi:ABC transporter ATP-binding protein [Actinocrinis puniceicyclus]|uniref:ABC transporter ATP-binding protein n=1 Tax=Actinocrinis puniceicyclus TaxID=977794 RepID=A0A8J7WK14_9ACTN|nr:ABC transporter ATP-binding protein [Actinocrinis puniceicyclus]MBS2961572.1 ABC transporter ATP-binding protein [Actinocrinis puniceicyclus]
MHAARRSSERPYAVEISGLVKRYGHKTAVQGLDLRVETGSLTAVLGPNGAGKTSTIECCEGYRRPDAGTVRVLGLDPITEAAALRPRIGVMLQSGGIYQAIRATEMLRHVASMYADPLDVDALIERLGLDSCGRTPFRRLSGGQQQRLSLALAVVGRPELVFLDEPTAGLDVQARHATWELIEQLRADGVTVVLTTHLLDEAERLADKVAIIDSGRVIAYDSPQRLADGTRSQDSIRFEAPSGMDLTALSTAVAPGCKAVESAPGSYRVEGEVTPDTLAATTAWCAGLGIMPRNLAIEQRSLEDVFLDLTGRELR